MTTTRSPGDDWHFLNISDAADTNPIWSLIHPQGCIGLTDADGDDTCDTEQQLTDHDGFHLPHTDGTYWVRATGKPYNLEFKPAEKVMR